MTDQLSTALTPTGDSEHPVTLRLRKKPTSDAEEYSRSQSKDMSNSATDDRSKEERYDTQLLHAEVSSSPEAAELKLTPVQDSPGPGRTDISADADQRGVPSATTSELQTARASDTERSHNDERVITGSPLAGAMQLDTAEAPPVPEDTDTGAAEQQDSPAAADLEFSPAAGIAPNTESSANFGLDNQQTSSRESVPEDQTTLADEDSYKQARPAAADEEAEKESEAAAAMPKSVEEHEEQNETGEKGEAAHSDLPALGPSTEMQSTPASLTRKSALLVAAKPSALLTEVARSLVLRGAKVTVAVKHTGDGQMFVKKLQRHLPADQRHLLSCTACPINFASQTSVKKFASAINTADEPLDLLLLHTVEASAASSRRWYTPEGAAGTAQLRFLGPATLLHHLHPKLTSDHTSVILTTTPLHRLGQLDDLDYMISSWAGASIAEAQLALLAYARQLADHCREQGVTVAAVDMGPLREQPLAGSLLRKVPPLHQLLHLLLPSAREAAHLLSRIAEDMTAEKTRGSSAQISTAHLNTSGLQDSDSKAQLTTESGDTTADNRSQQQEVETAASGDVGVGADLKYLELMMQHERGGQGSESAAPAEATSDEPNQDAGPADEQFKKFPLSYADAPAGAVEPRNSEDANMAKVQLQQKVTGGVAPESSATVDLDEQPVAAAKHSADDSFRYLSQGLLATPLLTAVDLAGRSSWLTHTLSNLTAPFYHLAAGTIVRGTMLMDWPVRAWLLAPAGIASRWGKSIMGHRAAQLLAQLQQGVPGVEGVPHTAAPEWVMVKPAGLVMDEKLGYRLWHMVEEAAA